jgi:hypothetical protein
MALRIFSSKLLSFLIFSWIALEIYEQVKKISLLSESEIINKATCSKIKEI